MNTRRLLQSFTALATLLLMAVVTVGNAQAQDIYVNSSGGNDVACNGTSPNVATIPNCPFQTMTQALTVAVDLDVIEVAAGTYPGGPFTFGTGGVRLTIQARNIAANDNVFLTGGAVNISANTTFNSVGAQFYPSGDLNLIAGTMTVDAAGTWNVAGGSTITRTNGAMAGAAPSFVGLTNLLYDSAADVDQVAGNEVPANMAGGTLTVNMTGVGTPTLNFPTSFTSGAATVPGTNNANVTWVGTLTAASIAIADANTHSFGNFGLSGGDYTQTGASTVTTGDAALNGNRLLHTGGTFTSTGTVTNNALGPHDGVAGDAGAAALIVHNSAGNMNLNNIDLSFAPHNNDAASDVYTQTIQKITGDLTIAGTITEGEVIDGDETDTSILEIIVEAGLFTVAQNNEISGLVDVDAAAPGGLRFSNGGTLNGDLANSGTVWITAGTLHLAPPGVAVYTQIADINGPNGLLHIHSDGDVPATGISSEGSVTLAGDNDGLGGAPLTVGGALTISGTSDWATAGGAMTITGGDVNFTGTLGAAGLSAANTLVVSSGNVLVAATATGDLLPNLTISGNLTVLSNADLDGIVDVDGTISLQGLNDIGNGDADSFSAGDDLLIGGTTVVSSPLGSHTVGGTLNVASGGTLSFTNDDALTFTADEVVIYQQTGGGPPNGAIILGQDNVLVVQGNFTGGFFDGTDTDLDGINARLAFVMPDNNSSFNPGPDTFLCDFSAYGNELTLTVTNSFEVQCNAMILDDSTVDLTNVLMRMTGADGNLMLAQDAELTSDPTTGAVSFEGSDGPDLDGFAALIGPVPPSPPTTSHITSMIVATPGFEDVSVLGNLEINGIMSLAFGGFTTGANTVTFVGPDAGIIINTDGTNADIDATGGTLGGVWDVTWNGANTVMGGTPNVELSATQNDDVTVNTTGIVTVLDVPPAGPGGTIDIAGNFNVNGWASVADPMFVNGVGNLGGATGAGVTDGAAMLTFDGPAGLTHNVTGDVNAPTTFASDATVDGSGSLTEEMSAVTVGADVDFTSFDQFEGLFSVLAGANASVEMRFDTVAPFDGADDLGDDGTMAGAAIWGDGTFTMNTNVHNVAGVFMVGNDSGVDALAAGLDMGGNTLRLFDASGFLSDFDSNLGTTGTLATDAAGTMVDTNRGGTTAFGSPADLPNLTVDVAATIAGGGTPGVEVVGWTDINAPLGGGAFLTVSNTVNQGALITNTVNILGTDYHVEGPQTIAGPLNIAATSVAFDEVTIAVLPNLTVTGLYSQISGDVSYQDLHLFLGSGLNWTAGEYTAVNGSEEIIFDSATFTSNNGEVSIQNVRVSSGALSLGSVASNDMLVVEDVLFLEFSLVVGTGVAPCSPAELTLGDSDTMRTWGLGGNVVYNCGSVTFTDATMYDLAYGGFGFAQTGASGAEMPAAFRELEINGTGSTVLAAGASPTVDLLDLNGGNVNAAANIETITIADGGTVAVGTVPGAALSNALAFAGEWHSVYEVAGFTFSAFDWPVAAVPTSFSTTHGVGTTTVGAPIRTAHDLNIGAASTLDLVGIGLNVTGDLSVAGTVISSGGGPLNIVGTEPQVTTAAITLPIVNMNNPTGLTLGGNLTIAGPPAPAPNLALTSGVITTGPFFVLLPHGGTAAQGFTRPAPGGNIFGNVRKQIVGGAPPMPADVMTFPTGTADGAYRAGSITFNDPSNISALAASGIFVTMNHSDVSPGGKNNMPLLTERAWETGDELPQVNQELKIARYAPMFWTVTASTPLSESVGYDVTLDATGYGAFVDENIERVRMIRRNGGNLDNFWTLVNPALSANDNYSNNPTNPVAVVRGGEGALVGGSGALFTMGLESNMTGVWAYDDPVMMNADQAQTFDLLNVFGGGTPLAGPPTYTYTPAPGKSQDVSVSFAGDEVTVTATAEGVSTVAIRATDDLNDYRDVMFDVQVNPVFMADDIDDAELNVGGSASTHTLDLSTIFHLGTAPVTYVVSSSDDLIATVGEAGGTLTVTAVDPGDVTIEVVGTDATGAEITKSFMVSVNAALSASAIAMEELAEGDAAHELDLSTVFSGGDGNYTYAVSTDATYIDASEAGGMLSAEVTESYDTSVSPPVTIGTIDVAVTATDGLGDSAIATLTIDVWPNLGNLDSDGPNPASASITLGYWLGNLGYTLSAKQAAVADMDGDNDVDPFDASQNFTAFFGKDAVNALVASRVVFGDVSQNGEFIEVPIMVDGDALSDVVSAGFIANIDPKIATVVGVKSDLSNEWLVDHAVTDDGTLRIGVAGYGELPSDGALATLTLQLIDRGAEFNLKAEGFVNNNTIAQLDELELTELPEAFTLKGNYPNPFNPSTTIQFDLPESANVEIQIFDMLGRRAMVIPAQTIEAGVNRSIQLNASALASGSYFYRVIASMDSKTLVEQGRMMLVK